MKEIRKVMKEKGINLLFLANFTNKDNNIRYFINSKLDIGFLIIKKSNAKLFVSPLEIGTINETYLKNRKISLQPLDKSIDKIISKELSTFKGEKQIIIGVNTSNFTLAGKNLIVKSHKELIKKLGIKQTLKFVDVGSDLINIRSVKSNEEIRIIKKSCLIANRVLESTLTSKTIKKLKTEKDLDILLHKNVIDEGCTLAFDTIVASRANAAIPHHISSSTPLKKGFLLIDFGVKYNGYHSDMTRTVYLGTPSKKEVEHYNIIKDAQKKATLMIRENTKCEEPHNLVVKEFEKVKLEKFFIHSLGHGIGLDIHEFPRLAPKSPDVFKNNMTFTNEPGLYFKGKYGIRIEDSLVLENSKAKVLTKMTKELIKIKI